MNRHIFQVFFYELKRNFRRRGFLFTTFGIPLIALLLLVGYRAITAANAQNAPPDAAENATENNDSESIKHAGYVDLSGKFTDPGQLKNVLTRYDDETAAQAALAQGAIDVYYLISADYLETGDVTLVMPRFSINLADAGLARQLILSHIAAGIDPDLFTRLLDPVNLREINLQRDASGQKESDFGSDFVVAYLFAIVLLLGVFTTNGYLLQTVIEEKETRLIEILVSTMKPTELLAGKILAMGLLGLLQIGTWLVGIIILARLAVGETALAAIASIQLPPDKLLVLGLYFVFGYLLFAAAYGMVSSFSSSMQEGPQYAVIFTLPAALPLYFIGLFTSTPDAPFAVGMSLFPITAPLAMVMRVILTSVPLWQIVVSLTLLVLLDIVLIWGAGRMFRVQTLLAGKVPKLRDIPKLLRG